jgi:outer membrane biosynthesis protein TonB
MQNDDNLRNWVIISACVHAALIVVMYFGLPSVFKPLPGPPLRVVPIDIVEIGDITNTRLPNQPELAAKAAPPAPKPEEKPQPAPKPPEPPKPEPKPEEKPTPPEPKPEEVALPKPQVKPKPPEPPKPEPKAQAQAQQDQLASILKNLTKPKPQPSKTDDLKKVLTDVGKMEGTAATGAEKGGVGPSLSDHLTISAEDALRRQISGCWNVPAGARNAQDLIVEVEIDVNPDRTVRDARVTDEARLATDPFFRAAAESAMRALRNPKCSPLELPADQYETWKVIHFTFDPRDML